MRHGKAAVFAEVIGAWLRSEWSYTVRKVPDADRRLIDRPDFSNPRQNAARRKLLRLRRGNLVDALPVNTVWSLVTMQPQDFAQVFILPSFDWYLDTGGTFRLLETRSHLQPGRGFLSEQGKRRRTLHHHHVQNILRKRQGNPSTWAADPIIIVTATTGGPWTIIDGTHRATAFVQTAIDVSLTAYCGYSRLMRRYGWHIESAGARNRIARARKYIVKGELW